MQCAARLFSLLALPLGFVDIAYVRVVQVLCKLKSEMCSACALQRCSARVQPVLHCVVHAGRHCARGVMWLYLCGVARNASLRFSLLSAPLAAPLFRPHSLYLRRAVRVPRCGGRRSARLPRVHRLPAGARVPQHVPEARAPPASRRATSPPLFGTITST